MYIPTWLLLLILVFFVNAIDFTDEMMDWYREKVKRMFYHAYNGYLDNAFPLDELKPISCVGHDTWGSFSLSLVDALDTLLVMGNHTEFARAVDLVLKSVQTDANVNVSVFETNIRVVGGLLSAHMLSGRVPETLLEDGWPCSGPLLRLAERMAAKLLPAFNTDTGMPYGTVNLRYGVHKSETPITCTAGVGTFIVEFGSLSRLTGDPVYELVATRALESLWLTRSSIGLVGNHINVQTGQWTAVDAGIGAGVDSYFEYLVKGSLLFQKPELMKQFNEYASAVNKHVRKEDWFMWVNMGKGTVSLPIFQSLEAFWPGLLTMVGDVEDASRIMHQYSQTIRQYGFPPEFYNIPDQDTHDTRYAYPLRPEIVESLMYLYRATEDPTFLEIGAQIVDAIEHSAKTRCGYATINNVNEHSIEDRMESFFLAETTKYLYLLFDPSNFLHGDGTNAKIVETPSGECVVEAGGYIYNTEAHPIDPSIVHCCSSFKSEERKAVRDWERSMDLGSLFDGPRKRAADEEVEEEVETEELDGDASPEPHEDYYVTSPETIQEQATTPAPAEPESKPTPSLMEKEEVLEQVRKLIRKARIMDDEKRQQGEKSDLADKLMKSLMGLESEYGDTILKAKALAEMDVEELKRVIAKRAYVRKIPTVEAECFDCCYPMDLSGDSVSMRHMMNAIYRFHLYPKNKISFAMGPVCRLVDQPKIEDFYMNEIPQILNASIAKPSKLAITHAHKSAGIEMSFEYELLTSPSPEFSLKFTGLQQVQPRRNSSWYFHV